MTKKKFKAVLFDLDGTLVDTTEFIYQAYEYVLQFHGFEITKREMLAPLIGRGLKDIYSKIAPLGDPQVLIDAHINFQSERFHLIKSFPDILDVINKLRAAGFKLGIVTSRMKNTPKTLESVGLHADLFDVIISADDVVNPKPHPEGVLKALRKLKVKSSEAVLVGDGSADIEMGKNAKVKTIGVTYGFGGKDIKNSKPDFLIDDILEILPLILES